MTNADSTNSIRLLIADDHHILLDGLRALLQGQPDMEVLGYYDNGLQLYEALPRLAPDIVVTDINMPGMDGQELSRKIREHHPQVKVIVLSMHDDGGHIMDLVDTGVSGYLLKNAGDKELLEAIRSVARGRMYFSAEVADKIEALVHQKEQRSKAPEGPRLTGREIEILKLVAQEYSNARIAETLFISERTVETHRKNMLRKTGNKSIVGLMRYAMERGLL